jgi:hypothetical protein
MKLQPLPGFDSTKIRWGGPDEPVSDTCSYCPNPISEDSVPLMMWTERGDCAVFCDDCMTRWFGMQPFDQPEDSDGKATD